MIYPVAVGVFEILLRTVYSADIRAVAALRIKVVGAGTADALYPAGNAVVGVRLHLYRLIDARPLTARDTQRVSAAVMAAGNDRHIAVKLRPRGHISRFEVAVSRVSVKARIRLVRCQYRRENSRAGNDQRKRKYYRDYATAKIRLLHSYAPSVITPRAANAG